ncbi:[Pyruvate dehydrogenase (acetyl-transferring)] kinase, mitochondrial [Zancudomyces culisetae]|uniref:Protein-serine/threonine kinase n=1 Tax=Zancudomyces culisetae TaxID=1213189 RepID=A0A1R1PWK8_ZANCU|nr:[Pyruvate dehydrogenase (acetyl-transferring)] kinase, mitochondrial [Zancudomyces culisetae]|eukprot:OMH85385.1 [Pyruvate dehydrogenase (acetyl-transferring)] kinase, mitochondrial [Zancudomyces culisetae]
MKNILSDLPKGLADKIISYAKLPQTGVSLNQMVKFGQNPNQGALLRASQFVHYELPIRLAHRVIELDTIPKVNTMQSINRVKNWYIESFNELIHFPQVPQKIQEIVMANSCDTRENLMVSSGSELAEMPSMYYNNTKDIKYPREVKEYNNSFVKLISSIKRRHDAVVATVAQGVLEYKNSTNNENIDGEIQRFLDRFYLSRIGIRMLIGKQRWRHYTSSVILLVTFRICCYCS